MTPQIQFRGTDAGGVHQFYGIATATHRRAFKLVHRTLDGYYRVEVWSPRGWIFLANIDDERRSVAYGDAALAAWNLVYG